MYTLEEIAALRQKCNDLKLAGAERLRSYTDEELQVICNGIGPEFLPFWIRAAVNLLHPTLEPAALIHDVEFEESDGTESSFTAANERFKENGCLLAKAEYNWYNPLRYAVMNQARRLANYCQLFGKDGFLEYAEREKYGTP